MKKYGFFGGSFNPVTKAHIELAIEVLNKYKLDKVIFVPMGDNYNKKGLISEKHRYNMLKLATKEYDKLEVSDIELNKDKSLTTLEAFSMIEEKYKNAEKYYIMGADNLNKMIQSKDFEILVENYKYIIIGRNSINCEEVIKKNETLKKHANNFIIMENKNHNETSSTLVRNSLKQNSTNEYEVDENVLHYIENNKLYSN